jgi:hypothetical protein
MPKPEGALLHLSVRTPDGAAAVARLVADDGEVIGTPREAVTRAQPRTLRARLAFCRVPDGERIE